MFEIERATQKDVIAAGWLQLDCLAFLAAIDGALNSSRIGVSLTALRKRTFGRIESRRQNRAGLRELRLRHMARVLSTQAACENREDEQRNSQNVILSPNWM